MKKLENKNEYFTSKIKKIWNKLINDKKEYEYDCEQEF